MVLLVLVLVLLLKIAIDFPPTQLGLALAWPRPEAQRRTRTRAAMSNGQGLKASCVHGSDSSATRVLLHDTLMVLAATHPLARRGKRHAPEATRCVQREDHTPAVRSELSYICIHTCACYVPTPDIGTVPWKDSLACGALRLLDFDCIVGERSEEALLFVG